MATEPTFNDFAAGYEARRPQVVWTRLIADLETPVSVMLKLGPERANTFLLELVEGGAVRGRYSVIGMDPDLIWRARGNASEIAHAGALDTLQAVPGRHARFLARAHRAIADRFAGRLAADGGRARRISRL